MAYYIINQKPIFLHQELHDKIKKEVTASWSALERVEVVTNNPKCEKLYKLVFDYLMKIDQQILLEKYYSFELSDKQASKNVFDLLHDYCHYNKIGGLEDIRNLQGKLEDDYMDDSFTHPLGKVFKINFAVKKGYLKSAEVSLLINSLQIKKLKGNLDNFVLINKNSLINFSKLGLGIVCG